MILTLKEGDRVRFISAKNHEDDPEYYPPVGTEGTVEEVMPPETGLERVALVKWHMREAMNMTWFASFGMMEKVKHGKADRPDRKTLWALACPAAGHLHGRSSVLGLPMRLRKHHIGDGRELAKRPHPILRVLTSGECGRTGKEESQMLIKISTKDMPREVWLQHRQKSIGGSDAAALLGLSDYASPYSLWAEKTGKVIPEDISDRESVRLGNDLEDYVAKRFAEATGKKVRRENAILQNPDLPFAHANIDRAVIGEEAGLECKTTISSAIAKECEEGKVPARFYCQCVHYLMVTGWKRWYLGVLVFGKGFYHFIIERDEAEIAALRAAEEEFWGKVTSNTPPDVDGAEATLEAIRTIQKESRPGMEIALMGVAGELATLAKLKEREKELGREIAEQQARIMSYMGGAERGAWGSYKVSYKTQDRHVFDKERFEQDHGKIPEEYYKVSTTRPLKLTITKQTI